MYVLVSVSVSVDPAIRCEGLIYFPPLRDLNQYDSNFLQILKLIRRYRYSISEISQKQTDDTTIRISFQFKMKNWESFITEYYRLFQPAVLENQQFKHTIEL